MNMRALRQLSIAGVALVAVGSVAGCHRTPAAPAPPASSAERAGVARSKDPGPCLLAAVDDTRWALGRKDRIAADNDMLRAATYARELTDHPSPLIGSGAAGPTGEATEEDAAAPLTLPLVQAWLESARTEITNGDLGKADGHLRDLQAGIRKALIPPNLPLLRARESLDLARSAAQDGRPTALKAQVDAARAALAAYEGPRRADAAALAEDLRKATAPSAMLPNPWQISAWAGRLDVWNCAP
jgi:hypothetical protein